TGGDVTISTATSVYSNIEKAATDAGRNSAYNATRKVIDDNNFFVSGDSKSYIRQRILDSVNANVINSTKEIEYQTGRQVYINNILIDNYTNATFKLSDITINQTDPFGFYVNVKGGIPVKVVQKGQSFEGRTPPISVYVTIEGLEDPYVWIKTKYRSSNIIYKYPYYTNIAGETNYYFDDDVDKQENIINHLYYCLNGTNNPSNITPRSYYFVDPNGLSFFDRLENKTTSADANMTRMSTFIIGDPLYEDHGRADISRLDREYFAKPLVIGTPIKIGKSNMADPSGVTFYLSPAYKTYFKLKNSY
ncbi:MAG: hypothetical protein Q8M97_12355, partial [Methanobacteriaceae archaeon]|nr:hypothetical protein [Methanobacteriaceae archaeon]